MGTSIRCQRCGELMNVSSIRARRVKCPHCQVVQRVGDAVASLPVVRTPDDKNPAGGQHRTAEPVEARIMPWVLSLLLHVGVALVLVFLTMIAVPADPPVVEAHVLGINPLRPPTVIQETNVDEPTDVETSKGPREPEGPDHDPELIRPNVDGGDSPPIELGDGEPGKLSDKSGDKIGLLGITDPVPPGRDRADEIVFVIDRSGSMEKTFGLLKRAMSDRIGRMNPDQEFHIILFSNGRPLEGPAPGLFPATMEAKGAAAVWLTSARAIGDTDPIPAIRRAFEVLAAGDGEAKVMYLLTDGVFPNNVAVVRTIAELNARREVGINTFLYARERSPVAERVMKRIAGNNGGRYNYIEID